MDQERIQEIFEDKYSRKLDMTYEEWLENAPDTEAQAYARCQEIDDELKASYDQWYDATGKEKDELEDYRDKLKIEYEMIEEMFGLELHDR